MTLAQDPQSTLELAQERPIPESVVLFPPTDLYSDEPPLESDLHRLQITLLLQCLEWLWRDRSDFYASGNLTVYYSPNQRRSEDFRGPDFFVVLGVERRPRKSWVVWGEDGKYPHVIVEILSESTADIDRGLKKQIYQDTFRTIEYFWFDPSSLEFAGFELIAGQYQPKQGSEQGWLWSDQLQLFLGIQDRQLRFFTATGELVPTPAEAALIEQQRADRAETHSARLAAKLRELGVDPEML